MSKLLDVVALSSGISVAASAVGGVPAAPVRVEYTALAKTQTPLPEGMRPPSLLANSTGSLLLSDDLFHPRNEVESIAKGSLGLVTALARAVPIDPEDEKLVGAAVAEALSKLGTKPLRRRTSG